MIWHHSRLDSRVLCSTCRSGTRTTLGHSRISTRSQSRWPIPRGPLVSDGALLVPPDLNEREQSKDHLSGETDPTGKRAVAGKLIPERPPEDGTQSDLSRHQQEERDQSHHDGTGVHWLDNEPIHAPAAHEPTRRKYYGCFHDNGSRLTEARASAGREWSRG
jgi:hypothetical protein